MIDIVLKREEKETVGVLLIPSWNTKGKDKTLAELHIQLDSFFDYLEEYDSSLKEDELRLFGVSTPVFGIKIYLLEF